MISSSKILKDIESAYLLDKNDKYADSDILFNFVNSEYLKLAQAPKPQPKPNVQVNKLRKNANDKLANIIYVYYKSNTNLQPSEIYRRMNITAKDSLYSAINKDAKGVAKNIILKQIYGIKDNVLRKNVLNLFNYKLSQAAKPLPVTPTDNTKTLKTDETVTKTTEPVPDYSDVYSKFYDVYNNAVRDLQFASNINSAQAILERSKNELKQFEAYVKSLSKVPNAKPHEILALVSSIEPLIKQKVKTNKGWDLK